MGQQLEKDAMSENIEQDTDDTALAQLITTMRIYDVLLALLHEQNSNKANELLELHSTGALVGSAPVYIGEFLTDRLNGA